MSLDPATLHYSGDGLVTCVCQDASTGDVLMVAWATREAIERTLETGRATFWSRSRGELWEKGATSGNALTLVEMRADCDGDTVLMRVAPSGPACHTGAETCFGPRTNALAGLARTITERRDAGPEASYVARLLGAPRAHVARKVGEEAVEAIVEEPGSDRLVSELADLWFHSMVLLAHDGLDPLAAVRELERRHREAAGEPG